MYPSLRTSTRILQAALVGNVAPASGFSDTVTLNVSITPTQCALHNSSVLISDLRNNVINPLHECLGTGYTRQPIPLVGVPAYRFNDKLISDPGRRTIDSLGPIAWSKGDVTQDWGTIAAISALDGAGNVLWFTTVSPINMGPNQVSGITIPTGGLKLQFDGTVAPTISPDIGWRVLRAIGRGENAGTYGAIGSTYVLWSANMAMDGTPYDYFDAPLTQYTRAIALHLGTAYNDAGALNNSLTFNNVPALFTEYNANNYIGGARPSLSAAVASTGPQPVRWTFVAGSATTPAYIQNTEAIRFPTANPSPQSLGAGGCIGVVSWYCTGADWVQNRLLAVVPAPNWSVPAGQYLYFPAGGLKIRLD